MLFRLSISICVCCFSIFNVCSAQQPSLVLPIGHTAWLSTIQFSADGKKLVTASADRTVKVWDVATGSLLADLRRTKDIYLGARFSPDGRKLVATDSRYTAEVWDIRKGIMLTEIKGLTWNLLSARFGPDGRKVIGLKNKKIGIWDAETGQLYDELQGHNADVLDARFSTDGKKIVSVAKDSTVKIWDTENGTLVSEFKCDIAGISAAQFSPDDKNIYLSAGETILQIWSLTDQTFLNLSAAQLRTVKLTDFGPDRINDPQKFKLFSPDGKKYATVSGERSVGTTVMIWDTRTNDLLVELKGHSTAIGVGAADVLTHNNSITTGACQFNADGKKFITVASDSTAIIWDVAEGTLDHVLKGHSNLVKSVQFDPFVDRAVTASLDNTAMIWDAKTGKMIMQLSGHTSAVNYAEFSPTEDKVVTASADGTARIWDISTGKMLFNLKGHTNTVYIAKFSPDGKKVVTASADQRAKIWDVNTGELLHELKGHGSLVWSIEFSNDGKKIKTSGFESAPIIWDVETGELLTRLGGYAGVITCSQFSPDGKRIVTGSQDHNVRIWDAETGKILHTLKGHSNEITTAQFSPDGEKIITASLDYSVKVWDTTGNLLENLKGHKDYATWAGFSPDGISIISVSLDNTIKKWDLTTAACLCTFIALGNADYIVQIPSGYFQCTRGAAKMLYYVTKDLNVISFEQLDVKYNRPDLVLSAIGNPDTSLITAYRHAYYKRIKKLGIDTTAFREGYTVPEADFINRQAIASDQNTEKLTLQVSGIDSVNKLDRFNLWVNEVPLYGKKGINIRSNNSNRFQKSITIQLSGGENRIETSVTNINGIESYRMPLVVNYSPPAKLAEKVYFIGIGIDKFQNPEYNLNYCSKDIRDLAAKLHTKYGDRMITDTLFNEKVTVANVKALKQKLLMTGVNDEVIVSYSGHGLLSKECDYYLSTYPINFDKPKDNGLPYDELENLLDSIPARKKLMMIDACHSGDLDKEGYLQFQAQMSTTQVGNEMVVAKISDSTQVISRGAVVTGTGDASGKIGVNNSYELMQNLFVNVSKSTGATVISAAAGTELALENGNLKNGVFTYCVMEALDKYPTMKISELKRRVGARVEELTNGLQKPTSRNEAIAVDWNVW